MLDLLTLTAACGLQGDLEKMRAARTEEAFEAPQDQPESALTPVAEEVSNALGAVEQAASAIADVMLPTTDMFVDLLPTGSSMAPLIDLSLPTKQEKEA